MKKIKLTQGKYVIVDNDDFEYLNQWKWYASSHGYAARHKGNKVLYMHRLIANTPTGLITDHINMDTLDNRKVNLRVGDKRLNSINRRIQRNNTSGVRGVSWNKKIKKWEVSVWDMGKKNRIGYFKMIKEATLARKEAVEKYYAI